MAPVLVFLFYGLALSEFRNGEDLSAADVVLALYSTTAVAALGGIASGGFAQSVMLSQPGRFSMGELASFVMILLPGIGTGAALLLAWLATWPDAVRPHTGGSCERHERSRWSRCVEHRARPHGESPPPSPSD